MWRRPATFVAVALALALAVGIGIGTLFPLLDLLRPSPKILNTAAILRQVQSLSQLVTVKFVIEKVVLLEDVKWYGENRVLMVAHGVVKGGVDLGQIKVEDIQVQQKKVVVRLPQATITDVYLDDQKTRVVERNTGILRAFDAQLEQNARRQAVDDLRRAARNSGIYDEANERARAQIRNLFLLMGFEQVEFATP